MQLVRDVLDKELVDRKGHKGGKVDDLVLELRPDGPPVVRCILTQQGALSSLLATWIGRLIGWLRWHLLRIDPGAQPIEVDWDHVTAIDVVVHTDIDRWDQGLMTVEEAVWYRWIKHVPFAQR